MTGTKDDWVLLRKKAFRLLSSKVDRKWGYEWKASLLPVLDRFVAAFDGTIDCLFWNSICKSGGGGSWLSGWFNVLFPYICTTDGQRVTNRYCQAYSPRAGYAKGGAQDAGKEGNNINMFPLRLGLSSAHVHVETHNENPNGEKYEYKMKFMAGMLGYTQCPKTYQVAPVIGWIIAYEGDGGGSEEEAKRHF